MKSIARRSSHPHTHWLLAVLLLTGGSVCKQAQATALPVPSLHSSTARGAAEAPSAPQIVQLVASIPWRQSFSTWRGRHPAAIIKAFHGRGEEGPDDNWWCYQATDGPSTSFFFALPSRAEANCQLLKYTIDIADQPAARLQALHRRVSQLLTARYGRAEHPKDVEGFGAAYWTAFACWKTKDAEIELFLDKGPMSSEVSRLGLIARGRPLVEFRRATEAHAAREQRDSEAISPPQDAALLQALGAFDPAAASWLKRDWPRDPKVGASVFATIERLLGSPPRLRPSNRPVALLTADRLATRFASWVSAPPHTQGERYAARMKALGLPIAWTEMGAIYTYEHPLLKVIWQRYPDQRWGQEAFAELLEAGWDTEGGDGAMYPAVIREGEAFLRKHPASPLTPRIDFSLGLAYETWWSLSQAVQDAYVSPQEYARGAQEARIKAIHYFERVADARPKSPDADYARLHLPRLRLGLDTGSRPYFRVDD